MEITKFEIDGLLLITPKVFTDERGYFLETWNQQKYADVGLKEEFVQDNLSYSSQNVLRGLHLQEEPHAQGKLVTVLFGEVLDVAVDLRKDSATFGQHIKVILSEENKKQLYIPPGFGHGFFVKSKNALFSYKCTKFYKQQSERTILWNDPTLKIDWSEGKEIQPIVSEKDQEGQLLVEMFGELNIV